mgnify:CR=1 FL=1
MYITWKLKKNDAGALDLDLDAGGLYTLQNSQAVRQTLESKLRLFHAEWFLHEDEGVLWIKSDNAQGLIGSKEGSFLISHQLKDIINSDKNIKNLDFYEETFDNVRGDVNIRIHCTDIYNKKMEI